MMRKENLIFALVIIFIAAFASGCGNDMIKGTGTIEYLSFEGGFYGIIADDGEHYDPTNLPQPFRQDGMRVQFKLEIVENQASFHMWGTIVEVIRIAELR